MKKDAINNFKKVYQDVVEQVKNSNEKYKIIIPNLLTASRLLTPFCILPATLLGNFPLALVLATIFALTDTFDGFLARKWHTTSEFGRNLDPVSDKFFTLGVIIPFLNNPFMIFTLILEGVIASINLNSALKNNEPYSTILGKGKTVLLSSLIILSYLFKVINIPFSLVGLFITTNLIQVLNIIEYKHIDTKQDKLKNKQEIKEQNNKIEENTLTNTQKQLLEYRQLKKSFTEEEKTNDKTIGQFKK